MCTALPAFLSRVKTVLLPFCRVCVYVFPYSEVVLFASDNMVVEGALPDLTFKDVIVDSF